MRKLNDFGKLYRIVIESYFNNNNNNMEKQNACMVEEPLWWEEDADATRLVVEDVENRQEDVENRQEDDDLEVMMQCRELLASVSSSNKDYQAIAKAVTNYLKNNCQHEFVYDYIEVDPEYGCTITYCKKCGMN